MELCVALDSGRAENLAIANSISNYNIWLKVGFRSFIRDGKKFIRELKDINPRFKIFLDLKLYDIPNTMADTAEEIASLGIDMFNIHASAGAVAMKTVMERLNSAPKRPIVLSVTALTSFDNKSFSKVYNSPLEDKVKEFAIDSFKSGVDGVVTSVFESRNIKKVTSSNFLTLTPGVRPFGEDRGDQKRVADIKKAKEELVDFIVVGRPIYQDRNPAQKVDKILKEIKKVKS
jgi:orotidine-5'-phosphate decarboxylase